MRQSKIWGLIPAAGVGSRMGAERPKQYLPLQGKPILMHTLQRLCSYAGMSGVLLGISEQDQYWAEFKPGVTDLPRFLGEYAGGAERADTVLNGILALKNHGVADDDWVLVHDAARPCIRIQDIDKLMQAIADHAAGGLLGLPVSDTVKRTDDSNSVTATVDRTGLWRALTPQVFRYGILKAALTGAQDSDIAVTDEASAVEAAGYRPLMVAGHADNIKITLPEDLKMAEMYLSQQDASS